MTRYEIEQNEGRCYKCDIKPVQKTSILAIKGDWKEVVNDCRVTSGKEELNHKPSKEFRRNILIAEHSPIRDITFKWTWRNIKSWIATHWTRHKWECFVKSQRSDRTGIPRDKLPQDQPVDFVGEANVQHLIDTMRKRLCYQSSKETREYASDLKRAIWEQDPDISDVLVPNCVYRCGCPEMKKCGKWEKFVEWIKDNFNEDVRTMPIDERYDCWNGYFTYEGRW